MTVAGFFDGNVWLAVASAGWAVVAIAVPASVVASALGIAAYWLHRRR